MNNQFTAPAFLYVQITESLIDWIESEKLIPGTRLPPERELSKKLGVNRATIRQALNMLEDRELICRKQGQGTFISNPKYERQAGKLVHFTKSMERKGLKTSIRMIKFEKILADTTMAQELCVSVGQLVYFIHRVRFVLNEPVLLEKLYVPMSALPGLEQYDLSKRSLYEVMETEYGIIVSRANQSLEPVNASPYDAELLEIKPGAPLMLERRVAFDQNDRPVERARDLFRGDRFRFITEMAPIDI